MVMMITSGIHHFIEKELIMDPQQEGRRKSQSEAPKSTSSSTHHSKLLPTTAMIAALLAVIVYVVMDYPARSDLKGEITVLTSEPELEGLLQRFTEDLGPSDMEAYKGHLYRVLSYALHFLHGDRTHMSAICAALVYHDIGLWTDSTMAYIEPSCSRASSDLRGDKRFQNPQTQQLIHDIIYWHHKVTPFRGPHSDVVNAVRKGDWIDATQGVVSMGMPRVHVTRVSGVVPYQGFHAMLAGFGHRLYGSDVWRIVREFSSIFKL